MSSTVSTFAILTDVWLFVSQAWRLLNNNEALNLCSIIELKNLTIFAPFWNFLPHFEVKIWIFSAKIQIFYFLKKFRFSAKIQIPQWAKIRNFLCHFLPTFFPVCNNPKRQIVASFLISSPFFVHFTFEHCVKIPNCVWETAATTAVFSRLLNLLFLVVKPKNFNKS